MHRKGFTLIELLAVMTIMMVLSGITVVAYRGFIGATAMTSAVSQMRQTLQLARQTAIVNGRDVYVVFWQDSANASNWYTTCMSQGYVTDLQNANVFVDRYNPELFQAVHVGSELFNLSDTTGIVVSVVTTVLANVDLGDFTLSNLCEVTTSGSSWESLDRYGVEIRKRMRMPKGFLFKKDPPTSVRFKPTGEAEDVGLGAGSTWSAVFYEIAKSNNVGLVTVDPFGFVRVEYRYN